MKELHFALDASRLSALGATNVAVLPSPEACAVRARAGYAAITDRLTYAGGSVPLRVTFSTAGRVVPIATYVGTDFDVAEHVDTRSMSEQTAIITVEILSSGLTFAECGGELAVYFGWHEAGQIEGL